MRKQLFIEKIMPVKLLNEQVYYEHGGNPFKGLHRWYSRKPLSFSRASVLASLLPAEISMEEFLYIMGLYGEDEVEFWQKSQKTEEEKDKLRNIKEVRLYKQPPSEKQIKRFNELCKQVWGTEKPSILDAFAGGGSIPFEGVRYGLNVFASDLNPVAVITMKAAMEYPLKFGADLQTDIDKWVKYVGDEAEKRLAEFFPSTPPLTPLTPPSKDGEKEVPFTKGDLGGSHSAIASSPSSNTTKANLGESNLHDNSEMIPPSPPSKGGSNIETVQNYLWAHTVTCPHCHSTIPLSPNWWLYKRPEKQNLHKWCAVKPIPNLAEKRVDFQLIKGKKGKKGTTITVNSEQLTGNSEQSTDNSEQITVNSEQFIDFDPNDYNTIGRGVGKCCNCGNVIEDDVIKKQAQNEGLGHQLYAVAFKSGYVSQSHLEMNFKANSDRQMNLTDNKKKKGKTAKSPELSLDNDTYKPRNLLGGESGLQFRIPNQIDLEGVKKAEEFLQAKSADFNINQLIPELNIIDGEKTRELLRIGIDKWHKLFNPRQLLTLVTYVEIINEAKAQIQAKYEPEKAEAIISYLALVLDRCADENNRLTHWNSARNGSEGASAQHSLNLMWNYTEISGVSKLWNYQSQSMSSDFTKLCEYINQEKKSQQLNLLTENFTDKTIKINLESADSLYHIPDKSLEAIITDPPYYGTIQYAELADFFYVWQKRTLGDIFPDIFYQELTDKDREAVANPSRFRNMGESADELAKQDYEAKMAMAWNEAYRVLKDDGVLTVQFNHKESGAWDVLAKALIDAGFEITASWAVSTENPQNLHQAKKNSVSSTVILVCRKRQTPTLARGGMGGLNLNGGNLPPLAPPLKEGNQQVLFSKGDLGGFTGAWWDDLRPEVANLVEARAGYFEDNDITGIDLYLSAFGVALNVFSKSYPILDSVGEEVRPEVAFAEARKAIASYRFRKLLQADTVGFDALTQWYLLAWDAFSAREFPFDEARQLALAIGGFNVNDLKGEYKLLDSASGTCKLLTPQQRLKKRAFTVNPQEFTMNYLIDGLHALIAIYEDEGNLEAVRQFMKKTGLNSNDLLTKCIEVAFKVIPDSMKEKQTLINLWLGIDEIKSKVQYFQGEMFDNK